MTGKTHKHGGYTSMLLIYPFILNIMVGLKLKLVEWVVMITVSLILLFVSTSLGSKYADLDHQNRNSIPIRNFIGKGINSLLRSLGATHRSWHTHALDITVLIFSIPTLLLYILYLKSNSHNILYLQGFVFMLGFTIATIVHLVLDMFSIGGIYISIIYLWIVNKLRRANGICELDLKKQRVTIIPINLGVYKLHGLHFEKTYPFKECTTGGEYEEKFIAVLIFLNKIGIILSLCYVFNVDIIGVFMTMLKDLTDLNTKFDLNKYIPKFNIRY